MTLAAIPSPSTAVWHLGPVPIRAYALFIVLGIIIATAVAEARLRRRGAPRYAILDVAVWAVPFGIVGARVYHVITSPQPYFGAGGHPLGVFEIWNGGLGIWGAVAGGAVGAWLACRQIGLPLSMVADAVAPGLPLAQAVGRLGNWFNNELYGGPTTLPWGLEVHRMDPNNPGHALTGPNGAPVLLPGLYHPTFLYEAVWDVGVAVLVLLADRRWKFGHGRAFALYVMAYTAGRAWVEMLRVDTANHFFGVRLNVWTSAVVFLGALIYFLRVRGARQYLVTGPDDRPVVVGEREFLVYRETGEVPRESATGPGKVAAAAPHDSAAGGEGGGGDDGDGRGGGASGADTGGGDGPHGGGPGAGGAEEDDEGADLTDGVALDDFADDETPDVDDAPADDDEDEADGGAGVRPGGTDQASRFRPTAAG